MTLPAFCPRSAPEPLLVTVTSWIASIDRRVVAVAEFPPSLIDGRYVDGSVFDAPSILKPFERAREPLIVYCAKAKLLFCTTPGRVRARRVKSLLPIGRAFTCSSVNCPPAEFV